MGVGVDTEVSSLKMGEQSLLGDVARHFIKAS